MDRTHIDAMAQHRAWQELNGLIGDLDAEVVTSHFAVTFERRVNEHGVAVRRVVMYGPEEVDPMVKAPVLVGATPLFEVTSSVAAA